jgi:hypothetical protein
MPKITTKEINSWTDLQEYINSNFTHFTNYIFRGHADAGWELQSTLARSISKHFPDEKDATGLASKHLQNFKLNARGKLQIDIQTCSEDELWATGQHFGLNTPLLDFTKSPYVALFFALQGVSLSGKRCIWAIGAHHIPNINMQQTSKKNHIEVVIPLSNHNSRLVSQQGLFLKIPLNCSFEKMLNDYKDESKGGSFFKIIFTNNFREEALLILQNMNITQANLFPDLIGSALHSNFQFEMEQHMTIARKKIWDDYYASMSQD